MTEQKVKDRALRKKRSGVVVSRSGDKSIVVLVETRKQHKLYKKVVRQMKKYHVHYEKNEAKVGDRVDISETRPLSKLKRWRLAGIM